MKRMTLAALILGSLLGAAAAQTLTVGNATAARGQKTTGTIEVGDRLEVSS